MICLRILVSSSRRWGGSEANGADVVAALAGSGVEALSITSAEGARECLGFSSLEGVDDDVSLLDLDMKLPQPLLNLFRGSVTVFAGAGSGSGVSSASGAAAGRCSSSLSSSSDDSSSDDPPLVSSCATDPGPRIPPNRFHGVRLRIVFLRLRGLRLSYISALLTVIES